MMYGYGLSSTPGMTSLGLRQYPRPSSQLNCPTFSVPSVFADNNTPRSSFVFPSVAPIKLGTGVVRPVSWATAFPGQCPPGYGVADGSAELGWSSMQCALQQSSAEHCGDNGSLTYGVATPATDAAGLHSNDAVLNGGMTPASLDSGSWSWTSSGEECKSGGLLHAFDSTYVDKPQRQTPATDDYMISSAVDSIDIDFTQSRDEDKPRRPVVTTDISMAAREGGSDPYVARVSVVDCGDQSLSTRSSIAVTDLTHGDRGKTSASISDEMEYGKATVFVHEIIDCESQQSSLGKSNVTEILRDRVTSSSSRDNDVNDVSLYTVTARVDGQLADQSSKSLSTVTSGTAAITSGSRQTQPANNSTSHVINNVVMTSAVSAESELNRAVPKHSLSAILATTEPRSVVSSVQPSPERWRQVVQPESSFEYSTGKPVSGFESPIEPVTVSNFARPPIHPSGSAIGGWRDCSMDNNFSGNGERFDTSLPTRMSYLSSDSTPQLPFVDRKQFAPGGAHASRPHTASQSSAFPDLDRQLQQLQLERRPADATRASAGKQLVDRQEFGGPRAVTSFLRADQIRLRTDHNGDKEIIGHAFKFLDEFDE